MIEGLEICVAELVDAPDIAEIHLTARRVAMPYLNRPHTDEETRDYFARVVGDRPSAWWIARLEKELSVTCSSMVRMLITYMYDRDGNARASGRRC
jgi:hypothetical protein